MAVTLPGLVIDGGSLPQRLRAMSAGTPVPQFVRGTVTGVDGSGVVTVNVGGNALAGLSVPGMPVAVGDSVLVLRQGASAIVAALLSPTVRPTSGTVASVPSNSSAVIVTTPVGSIACGWVAAYTPTVGDSVWIAWLGSQPVVMGKQGVTGSPPPAPTGGSSGPPPPPKITTGTNTFTAVSSGTWRSGWQDSSITGGNVMQGDYGYGMNSGAWFLGGRPHATLAGATVTGARIYLQRVGGGTYAAQTIHLCRVTNNTQPAGAPSFDTGHAYDGVALAVGQSGWYSIPVSLAQAIVDSGGSVGVQGANPYVRLAGVPNNGSAGALSISWSRSS